MPLSKNAFLKTCDFFENNDEEQLFLSDLIDKMEEFSQDTDFSAYDRRHMKRKLEEFYGDDIIISGGHGNPTIVTYRQSVNSILRDYYSKSRDVDVELQKLETRKDIYPLVEDEFRKFVFFSSKLFTIVINKANCRCW